MSAFGTKRTSACALHMSAFDPKRTLETFRLSLMKTGSSQIPPAESTRFVPLLPAQRNSSNALALSLWPFQLGDGGT